MLLAIGTLLQWACSSRVGWALSEQLVKLGHKVMERLHLSGGPGAPRHRWYQFDSCAACRQGPSVKLRFIFLPNGQARHLSADPPLVYSWLIDASPGQTLEDWQFQNVVHTANDDLRGQWLDLEAIDDEFLENLLPRTGLDWVPTCKQAWRIVD